MKKSKEKLKYGKKGITLISLVITIIVLLILVGVTINLTIGENGIFRQATRAGEEYSKAEAKEKVSLLLTQYGIEKATNQSSDFANFLRKNLQVGVAQNEDNTYSFILDKWQIVTNEDEVINIEEFKLEVDKTYPNVASMKTDTSLTDGQLVKTEGYWDKQYGGSAYYDIVSSTSLTPDDTKCIQLNNGLYAELHPINDTVTVNQFGAYGDGEHDDAEAIQLALNSGYGNVSFEGERYKFGNSISLFTDDVYLIGNNATLFWDENTVTRWAQIEILGTSDKHVQNINISYLNFENGNISNSGESVQLVGRYCDNIGINNCKFNIYEIDGNKSRQLTNLWFHTEWKNITVQDCEFINLTNSNVGGNIWLSNQLKNDYICGNAKIINNTIIKSCHDESIGIWNGIIENIIIDNNKFDLNEDNVENPSFMNFTFGNEGGTVSNITFTNNEVKSKYAGIFALINGESGSNNIFIQNNKLQYEKENLNYDSSFIQNNSNTENVIVDSNTINIIETNNRSFARGKITLKNNQITINSNNLQVFVYIYNDGNSEQYSVPEIIDNEILINGNGLAYQLIGGSTSIIGNTIKINGSSPNSIIQYSDIITEDINISSNHIIISDSNLWEENSKSFINFAKAKINNVNVNVINNVIETENQENTQRLVYLNNLQDTSIQKIIMNNNQFGQFKFLNFLNNNLKHVIIVNGKEITTNTTLE